jgi:glutaredoxin
MPIRLTVYSGPGCSLCDKAKLLVERVRRDVPFDVEDVDITTDPDLYARFRYAIPVIALDGQPIMAGKVTEFWLRKALRGEALDKACLAALEGHP